MLDGARLLQENFLSMYYVPSSVENAGVTMASGRSPIALRPTGDKSVNKDTNQVISDPGKSCKENKA